MGGVYFMQHTCGSACRNCGVCSGRARHTRQNGASESAGAHGGRAACLAGGTGPVIL
jgi:hypothetical protein